MAIVKMKHLRLVAMAEDRESILRLLQHMGCVEVSEASLEEADEDLQAQLKDKLSHLDSQGLSQAREEQTQAERALGILKRNAPEKGSFLSPKPQVEEETLFREDTARAARSQMEEINSLVRPSPPGWRWICLWRQAPRDRWSFSWEPCLPLCHWSRRRRVCVPWGNWPNSAKCLPIPSGATVCLSVTIPRPSRRWTH